uniref:Uncharacterized protein n=1 Tax=Clytia hemisphaerica TaxID=252671 RepID=A0A7M5V537_9CNID
KVQQTKWNSIGDCHKFPNTGKATTMVALTRKSNVVKILVLMAICAIGQYEASNLIEKCKNKAVPLCPIKDDFYACVQSLMEKCLDRSDAYGQRIGLGSLSCAMKTLDVEVCWDENLCQLITLVYHECV